MKLLFFSSPTCAPCAMMKPAFIEYVNTDNVDYELIDITTVDPDVLSKYEIRSVPSIVFEINGDIAGKLVGAQPITKIKQMVDVYNGLNKSFKDTQCF